MNTPSRACRHPPPADLPDLIENEKLSKITEIENISLEYIYSGLTFISAVHIFGTNVSYWAAHAISNSSRQALA